MALTEISLEAGLAKIAEILKQQKLIIFIGAGFSRDAGVPTAEEITKDLRPLVFERENPEVANGAYTDQVLNEYFKGTTYAEMLKRFSDSKIERREFLEKYFADKEIIHQGGHSIVAKLLYHRFIPIVITTNFDRLLENTYIKVNHELPIVFQTEYEFNQISLMQDSPRILKLHGDFLYDDIANLNEEMKHRMELIAEQVEKEMKERSILVLGYSGCDDSVMSFLEGLEEKDGYIRNIFWVQYGKKLDNLRIQSLLTKNPKKENYLLYCNDTHAFLAQLYRAMQDKSLISEMVSGKSIASGNYSHYYIQRSFIRESEIDKDYTGMQHPNPGVAIDDLLNIDTKIIILHGQPGSGKTVFLTQYSNSITQEGMYQSVYFDLRDTIEVLFNNSLVQDQNYIICIDGCHEILDSYEAPFYTWLVEIFEKRNVCKIIMTLQSAYLAKFLKKIPSLPFALIRFAEINSDDRNEYIISELGDTLGPKLIGELGGPLKEMCKTPLYLHMLCMNYRKFGHIPANITYLYREFIFTFLYSWQEFSLRLLKIQEELTFLENICWQLKLNRTTHTRLRDCIEDLLRERNRTTNGENNDIDPDTVIVDLISLGLFEESKGIIYFYHDSIIDFLVASKLLKEKADVSIYFDHGSFIDVLQFYSGMLDDSSELIDTILNDRGHDKILYSNRILLAATCLVSALHIRKSSFLKLFRVCDSLDLIRDSLQFLGIIIRLRAPIFFQYALQLLESPASSPKMRGYAKNIVQQYASEEEIVKTRQLLTHYNPDVQWRVVSVLIEMNAIQSEDVSNLLQSKDKSVLYEILLALPELKFEKKQYIPYLLKLCISQLMDKKNEEDSFFNSLPWSTLAKLVGKDVMQIFKKLLGLSKEKDIDISALTTDEITEAVNLIMQCISNTSIPWYIYYKLFENLQSAYQLIPDLCARLLVRSIKHCGTDDVVVYAINELSKIGSSCTGQYLAQEFQNISEDNDRTQYQKYCLIWAVSSLSPPESRSILKCLQKDLNASIAKQARNILETLEKNDVSK